MMKRCALLGIGILAAIIMGAAPVHAESLKIQPLSYTETLQKNEKKKGIIDISNPTGQTLKLKTSVQAFRQINDRGGLEFYDSEQISAGIIPDFKEFTLAPRQSMRMVFLIDGSKLPSGDVFAALFVSTIPSGAPGVNQSVRVGTILSLVNGTPGARNAAITSFTVPFWQYGDAVTGKYSIKNVAKTGENTGFYPEVTIALDPMHGEKKHRSTLVFAGRERENEFSWTTGRFGFYRLSVKYNDSVKSSVVFVATGWGQFVPVIIAAAGLVAGVAYWRRSRRSVYRFDR